MDILSKYRVIGTSRQVGAIGQVEAFHLVVIAASAKEAYNAVRDDLYMHNREHVHVLEITVDGKKIEPEKYLE